MDLQQAEHENPENEEQILGPEEPYPVVIAPLHFILLSIATFSFYTIWWQYKCWKYFKEKEKSDSIPILWTLLFFIFGLSLIPLFERIKLYCRFSNHQVRYNSFILWLLYVSLSNFLPYQLMSWIPLLIALMWVPFIGPVMEFNFYFTGNRNGYKDDKLNQQQIILLIVGAFLWVSVIQAVLTGNFPPPDFFNKK